MQTGSKMKPRQMQGKIGFSE